MRFQVCLSPSPLRLVTVLKLEEKSCHNFGIMPTKVLLMSFSLQVTTKAKTVSSEQEWFALQDRRDRTFVAFFPLCIVLPSASVSRFISLLRIMGCIKFNPRPIFPPRTFPDQHCRPLNIYPKPLTYTKYPHFVC